MKKQKKNRSNTTCHHTTSQNEPYLFPDLAITSIYFYVILWKNNLIFFIILKANLLSFTHLTKRSFYIELGSFFFFCRELGSYYPSIFFSYMQTKVTSLTGQKSKLICKKNKRNIIVLIIIYTKSLALRIPTLKHTHL